jgi:hypothetical protein
MSYLLQYAGALLVATAVSSQPNATFRPGLYGDAYVRVFVEDTTARRRRHNRDLRLTLRIADCDNTINLEFSLDSPELRENSLFKIDTLLETLHRFRDALALEAELAEQRDHSRRRGGAR